MIMTVLQSSQMDQLFCTGLIMHSKLLLALAACVIAFVSAFVSIRSIEATGSQFESGGVLRYDTGTGDWTILNDTTHEPINLYPTILNTTWYIYVYFQDDYETINWGYSNPDESLIKTGIDCGPRIHLDGMQIWCSKDGAWIPTDDWADSADNIWVYAKGR